MKGSGLHTVLLYMFKKTLDGTLVEVHNLGQPHAPCNPAIFMVYDQGSGSSVVLLPAIPVLTLMTSITSYCTLAYH
jgi:hypothetical protein